MDHFAIIRASCVLVDINQGDGLSGIELCKRLRASGQSLNIIMMTGVDILQNKKKAAEAGCNTYLHKPFSSRTLIDAIEKRVG